MEAGVHRAEGAGRRTEGSVTPVATMAAHLSGSAAATCSGRGGNYERAPQNVSTTSPNKRDLTCRGRGPVEWWRERAHEHAPEGCSSRGACAGAPTHPSPGPAAVDVRSRWVFHTLIKYFYRSRSDELAAGRCVRRKQIY
ncbi:hypothetical protein EVAR_43265_1 [Eumeta japonica]|uniref:Uncharacterized protein n=1 Tax=Eumeta variegata TaxID=151549 RepID=A0A4C1WTQ1_EUMVA|nr:hypothetical protein EVAR_43265_1 [Eumeta japonica]